MNRINQINNELKIIRECVKAAKFLSGISENGLESENASNTFDIKYNECLTLDSSIVDMDSIFSYREKLIRERAVLRTQENRVMFQKWVDKPNYKKLIKVLSKYGKNQTEAFNRFINEL
jgi:hypothetical protein